MADEYSDDDFNVNAEEEEETEYDVDFDDDGNAKGDPEEEVKHDENQQREQASVQSESVPTTVNEVVAIIDASHADESEDEDDDGYENEFDADEEAKVPSTIESALSLSPPEVLSAASSSNSPPKRDGKHQRKPRSSSVPKIEPEVLTRLARRGSFPEHVQRLPSVGELAPIPVNELESIPQDPLLMLECTELVSGIEKSVGSISPRSRLPSVCEIAVIEGALEEVRREEEDDDDDDGDSEDDESSDSDDVQPLESPGDIVVASKYDNEFDDDNHHNQRGQEENAANNRYEEWGDEEDDGVDDMNSVETDLLLREAQILISQPSSENNTTVVEASGVSRPGSGGEGNDKVNSHDEDDGAFSDENEEPQAIEIASRRGDAVAHKPDSTSSTEHQQDHGLVSTGNTLQSANTADQELNNARPEEQRDGHELATAAGYGSSDTPPSVADEERTEIQVSTTLPVPSLANSDAMTEKTTGDLPLTKLSPRTTSIEATAAINRLTEPNTVPSATLTDSTSGNNAEKPVQRSRTNPRPRPKPKLTAPEPATPPPVKPKAPVPRQPQRPARAASTTRATSSATSSPDGGAASTIAQMNTDPGAAHSVEDTVDADMASAPSAVQATPTPRRPMKQRPLQLVARPATPPSPPRKAPVFRQKKPVRPMMDVEASKRLKPVKCPASLRIDLPETVSKSTRDWLLLNMFRHGDDTTQYEPFIPVNKDPTTATATRPRAARDIYGDGDGGQTMAGRRLVGRSRGSGSGSGSGTNLMSVRSGEVTRQQQQPPQAREWVAPRSQDATIPAYDSILDKYCKTVTSPVVQRQIYAARRRDLSPQLALVLEKRALKEWRHSGGGGRTCAAYDPGSSASGHGGDSRFTTRVGFASASSAYTTDVVPMASHRKPTTSPAMTRGTSTRAVDSSFLRYPLDVELDLTITTPSSALNLPQQLPDQSDTHPSPASAPSSASSLPLLSDG